MVNKAVSKAVKQLNHKKLCNTYINHNLSPLSTDEQNNLISRYQEDGCMESRRLIIESNLPFVISIASRKTSSGVITQDLINEGCIGLMRAIESFDVDRGIKFTTYANAWVKKSVLEAYLQQKNLITLPKDVRSKIYHSVDGAQCAPIYTQQEEIQEQVDHRSRLGLTDEPQDIGKVLSVCVGKLKDKEAAVIRGRFISHLTLEDVGKLLGVTRERVRQIEKMALKKLKRELTGFNIHENVLC